MPQRVTVLERAFELARSGEFTDLPALAKQLKVEGFIGVERSLAGPSLRRQLRELCARAQAAGTQP